MYQIKTGGLLMRCLFCKQDSTNSRSVEHIIPESLGNTTQILPKGIVCDKCNNYFARKIEEPFLNSTEMLALRFQEAIPNKKNVIPPLNGILNGNIPIKIYRPFAAQQMPSGIVLEVVSHGDIGADEIHNGGQIITPAFMDSMIPQNSMVISRFIAKIAFEFLALRLYPYEGGLDYLIDDPAFDSIRNYVRKGSSKSWACNIRRIYNMDKIWACNNGSTYQKVNESDFLFIPVRDQDVNSDSISGYMYFVLALFGLEFAISITEPGIDGMDFYRRWLMQNDYDSPLFRKK